MDAVYNIKIEYVRKDSADGSVETQSCVLHSLQEARNAVLHLREKHQKDSHWFKLYNASGQVIFDSKMINYK